MTDHELEQRLRDWYHAEIPDDETAPAALRSSVATIPQDAIAWLGRSAPPRELRLLAVAAILSAITVGGALIAGSAIVRPPLVVAPPVVAPPDGPVSARPLPSSAAPTRRFVRNGAIAVTREGSIALLDPVSGKTTKTFSVDSAGELTWAPDGRRLAFTAPGGVWVMNVSDGTSQQILSCGEGPEGCTISWAPDGSRIAVAHGGTLELVDPDGSNRATVLVQDHPVDRGGLRQPTWSPDGSRIAFGGWLGSHVEDGSGLYAVDRDGSNPSLIHGPASGIGTFDPAWSPDGSTIAYFGSSDAQVCRRNNFTSTTTCDDQWQLHVMSLALAGDEPRELHDAGICYCLGFAPSLTWSPDGTRLAFVGSESDNFPGGLTVMNADGSELRQVNDDGDGPAWQPVPCVAHDDVCAAPMGGGGR
jgi:Tol biopolymer transport system component